MYNVLIVDDDSIICAGLQKLIEWEAYGFVARDIALNGMEALEKLDKAAYDLIITDVRMPKLDGIELIKAVNQRNYPSKVIILSGYRDFEYAQTALEFGVKKYILKPVNEKILISAITDIKNEIDESIRQKLVLDESKTILREKAILELFKSQDKHPVIYKKLKNMNIDPEGKVFQVCIIAPARKEEGEDILAFVIKKAVEEIIDKYSAGYVADMGSSKIAVLFCRGAGTDSPVRAICEEIVDYVNKCTRNIVNISIGNEATEYKWISQSFHEAASINSDYFLDSNRHILSYDDILNSGTIESIIKYVRENCCEKLTLQSISNKFFFNPAYVGRIFKNHTGMKFNDFLIECKMEKAVRMLENSKSRVSDIALKVGYTDYDHFCKVFRSKMGCTPSEYKSRLHSSN